MNFLYTIYSWAVPGKKEQITKLKPYSNIVEEKFTLTTYERVIQVGCLHFIFSDSISMLNLCSLSQILNVPAYQYPLLLRIVQAGLPEGVTLRVVEHDSLHDEVRYLPDTKMKELKDELEDLGGVRKKKKKF